jgi:hypothetical protein
MAYLTFYGFWAAWFGTLGLFITQASGEWLALAALWWPLFWLFFLWHRERY